MDGNGHIVVERDGGSNYDPRNTRSNPARVAEASKSAVITSLVIHAATFAWRAASVHQDERLFGALIEGGEACSAFGSHATNPPIVLVRPGT